MKALEKQDRNDEQQDSDDKKIKFATGLAPYRFTKIDIFCALDSFRCKLECPGKNHRHRKSDNEQQHYKTYGPIRNFEERENLTRDLHQQPCDDCVSDRNFVNVAPFQLSEEVLRVHSELLRTTRDDFFRERFETRITAQRIEERVNSDIPYVRTGAILITFFKPAERLLFVAKPEIDKSKAVR